MGKRKKRKHPKGRALAILLILGLSLGLFSLYRAFPLRHGDTVKTWSTAYGVDPYLVLAVIHTESRFQEDAVSPAGALGLMQVTKDTGKFILRRLDLPEASSEAMMEPELNIRMGTYYLSYLMTIFPVQDTVLAAYNAGPGRVREWLEDSSLSDGEKLLSIPFEETRNYVEKVRAREKIYRILYFFRF